MPRRRTLFISAGGALLLLLAAIAFITSLSHPPSKPTVTITLLDCKRTEFGYFYARVAITNISGKTILYHEMRQTQRIRIETKSGWITNSIMPDFFLRTPTVLPPSSNDVDRIHLPHNAVRFQLCYAVPTLSPQESLGFRLPEEKYPRLNPLLKRVLSDKPGPDIEISSALFQVRDDNPP